MALRRTRDARRQEVAEATLVLLVDTPVDRLTTRQIARALGLTQPALFRHFRSRDAILAEVVEHVREELATLTTALLLASADPTQRLRALGAGLVGLVERRPGIARLLFWDPLASGCRPPLQHLASMLESLTAEFVRDLAARGELAARVEPDRAAAILLALFQGLLLRWLAGGRAGSLAAMGEEALGWWLGALRAGLPARPRGGATSPEQAAETDQSSAEGPPAAAAPGPGNAGPPGLLALDVRPILGGGRDPLAEVLGSLRGLPCDGVLLVTAPFCPAPLIALLQGRGWRCTATDVGGTWEVEIAAAEAPAFLDLRLLEPPGPLEAILRAAPALAPGAALIARMPRVPRLLLPHLDRQGLSWTALPRADGTALLHVRRPG